MATDQITRIFVVGGKTSQSDENIEEIQRACELLGESIGSNTGYRLVVCSPRQDSADANVVKGYAKTRQNQKDSVIVHFPDDKRPKPGRGKSLYKQWKSLIDKTKINAQLEINHNAQIFSNDDFKETFLQCQIKALTQATDVVVVLGGQSDASSSRLLAIARGNYPIVPFAYYGGAGKQEYLRQQPALRESFSDKPELVDALTSPDGVRRAIELIEGVRKAHRHRVSHHVFLSYSWARPQEADYVEAFLRRFPWITLFRDEEGIKSGDSIKKTIDYQLKGCKVFLALWCAEYAASPHCYDELAAAMKRKKEHQGFMVHIIRLDDTRPVWPTLRADKSSHEWEGNWKENKSVDQKGIRDFIAASLMDLLSKLPRE